MKKLLLPVAAVCATLFAAACKPASDFDALNDMLHADYSEISVSVKNVFDEDTFLESAYTFYYTEEGVRIRYSVERFLPLSEDLTLDESISSSRGKTTLKGEALAGEDGIITVGGIGLSDRGEMGITFREEYFENADRTDCTLVADVKSPGAFLGVDLDCSAMRMKAAFLTAFLSMEIFYISEGGSTVEIQYIFSL